MTLNVVVFSDGNVVAIAPRPWLDGNSCYLWLPYASSNKNRKAVQKEEEALDNWKLYTIKTAIQIYVDIIQKIPCNHTHTCRHNYKAVLIGR